MTSCETALAERLISALFQVDRARTPSDEGAARAALTQALRDTQRVGTPLTLVSRMSGLSPTELRQLLD